MPPKDPRLEAQNPNPETAVSMKRVERFLRVLTWQLFFLLALLFYLAMRPQAGRYQFTVAGEDVVVFDTASSRAVAVKLERQVVPTGEKPEPGAPPAAGERK
jgi:hypothetical protein